MFLKIKKFFPSFWEKHPALFCGLILLLGTVSALRPHSAFTFLFFFFFCFLAPHKKWWLVALICFSISYFHTVCRYPEVTLPSESIEGTGRFQIHQIKVHTSPFHHSLLYQGTLKDFTTSDGKSYPPLPCHIYLPLSNRRPLADTDYKISGKLCQKGEYAFVLKPNKTYTWQPLPTLLNLAEWRFRAKQSIAHYLKKEISSPAVQNFLNALATGHIDERILGMEFSKVGLQHILAISGFHFALMAFFFHILLNLLFPFLPFRIRALFLFVLITLYYLFLGNAPSIQRAYVAIALVIIGQLLNRRLLGLNALGVGLMVELLFYPLVVMELSFQLTFLCTLAILLFTPAVHRGLTILLPERSFKRIVSMNLLDQHGYILSAMLRKTLAINFAVHFISLPVLLHLFHKFPLLSIAYNIFFPACVCLSLFFLFFALLLAPCFPLLSHLIHHLNHQWTSMILTFTSNPPFFLDFSLRTKGISFSTVIIFLAISFFFGVIFYEKDRLQRIENKF